MKTVISMILTLSIIGIVAGGLLAGVSEWATPFIEANKKAETERAIFIVQPNGKTYEKLDADFEVYKVFNEDKNEIGYSLVYEGNGFQGKIRLMVGLTDDLSKITAMEVLEQSETPGLGTRVTEDPYKGQYKDLVTTPHIEWVKGVPPTKPNEIQAITGATISSKSVVAIVNAGIDRMRELQERGEL
jgi:Na+-translocating ferredoxin:NAD+ oxidoreductase subunit G